MSRFHLGVFHSFIFFPVYIINFINCLGTSLGFKFRSIRSLKSGSNILIKINISNSSFTSISHRTQPQSISIDLMELGQLYLLNV